MPALAMAFVMHLAERARAASGRQIEQAALHFGQMIVYQFCRITAGLRNLLTAEQLQAQLPRTGDG